MTGPCTRPECGGEVHTDGWGNPIQCPALYEPDATICPLVQREPHDAHEYAGLRCPGWMPDDGTRPEQPPEPSELEQLRADNESLRYQIQRAREALGTDEPVETAERRNAIARVRALHREEYGCCAECTSVHDVPYPCPTIRAIDGQEPLSDQPDQLARIAELEGQLERVHKVVAERRVEVAEREADGILPFGTPGASWCDAITVTCARIEDALRVRAESVGIPANSEQEEQP